MTLCTVEDVYRYLKQPVPPPDSDEEKMARMVIEGSSTYFRQHCGRPLLNEIITEKHNGHGFDSLRLNYSPIQTITTVIIDGEDRTEDIEHDWARVFCADGFPLGRRNIEVTYTAGFGETPDDIPRDLRFACVLLAHFRMKTDQMQVPMEYQEGPVILQSDNNYMPKEVRDAVRQYRRAGF